MDWLRERFQRAPVLMGCLSAMVLLCILGCGAGLLVALGGVALFNKVEDLIGVRDPIELSSNASAEGWMLGVHMEESTLNFTLRRFDEGPADCATAWRLVGPHLIGSAEFVDVRMYVGEEQDEPKASCRWKGFPKAGTEMPEPVDVVPAPAEPTPAPAEATEGPTPVGGNVAPSYPSGPPPPAPGSTEVAPPAAP